MEREGKRTLTAAIIHIQYISDKLFLSKKHFFSFHSSIYNFYKQKNIQGHKHGAPRHFPSSFLQNFCKNVSSLSNWLLLNKLIENSSDPVNKKMNVERAI